MPTPRTRGAARRRSRPAASQWDRGARVEHTATGWIGTIFWPPQDRLGVETVSVRWHTAPPAPRPLVRAPGRLGRIGTPELTLLAPAPEIVE